MDTENTQPKKRGLNLPNTLSLIRVVLVPVFLACALYLDGVPLWGRLVPMLIFALASLTDMLDGKIARKYNLITDFGKFLDPLADKFMVFGALLAILFIEQDPMVKNVFVWVAALVIFRELAITSLRMVIAGSSGKVLAASFWGKAKTCTQIAAILVVLADPLFASVPVLQTRVLSYVFLGLMAVATLFSGIDYARAYLPLIDTNR